MTVFAPLSTGAARPLRRLARILPALALVLAVSACAGPGPEPDAAAAAAPAAASPAPEPATGTNGPPDPVTDDHPLSDFFDNTMIVHEQGKTMKIWYNRDRTLSAEYSDGFTFTGVWENWGEDFCQTQTSDPRPGEERWERCGKLEPFKVGDEWERRAPDGTVVNISLVAGR
ncbi:hypothetical protein GCM10009613_29760 [Pseudonocardia kongjuensis]|uniref:Uncharacterized protein n=1 Tax=Pseudonocardia kongjuensis TaxID=102227 RepID=A0ABN1XZ00_9PSEU